jgi:hypothetical protein
VDVPQAGADGRREVRAWNDPRRPFIFAAPFPRDAQGLAAGYEISLKRR